MAIKDIENEDGHVLWFKVTGFYNMAEKEVYVPKIVNRIGFALIDIGQKWIAKHKYRFWTYRKVWFVFIIHPCCSSQLLRFKKEFEAREVLEHIVGFTQERFTIRTVQETKEAQ